MDQLQILIEGSGRHIHLSRADLDTLFGAGFVLEVKKELSQPGQYAAHQKVDVVGPRGTIKGVSILGPCRAETQVEISFTDARVLGLSPQIRESGDLADTDGCTLIGPAGQVELKRGVIVAKRHLHLSPETAARYGIADREVVCVQVEGPRAMVMDQVVARVAPGYVDAMHIDYDELNAAALFGRVYGTVLKKQS